MFYSNRSFISTNEIQGLISFYLECSTYLQNGVLNAEQAFLPGVTITGTCNEGYVPLLGSLNATCDSDYNTIMSDRCVQSEYYFSRWLSGPWAFKGYTPKCTPLLIIRVWYIDLQIDITTTSYVYNYQSFCFFSKMFYFQKISCI